MIFCNKCFNDKELSSIIKSNSKKSNKKCPICKSEDVYFYDTEKDKYLSSMFEELLNIYSPVTSLTDKKYLEKADYLINDLNDRMHIFSQIANDSKLSIIKEICLDNSNINEDIFINRVYIPELFDPSYMLKHSLLKKANWNEFLNEIKTINRYNSKAINEQILEKFCSYSRKQYKKGTLFYRARISDKNGYQPNEMSIPELEKRTDGRVNAKGITCLYLSNSIKTTLYEVRAGMFDYVTVGTFVLKADIVVVDLGSLNSVSPFIEELDYLEYAVNIPFLERINKEISKPVRRNDSVLDYVPTQYIADIIKSFKYDDNYEYNGIEFKSTIDEEGYNLAIFNPDLFECISSKVYEINKIDYNFKNVINKF